MAESLRLGDHCEKIGSGATPRGGKETYSDDGPIALIRSQNVRNERFLRSGLAYISDEQAAQLQNVVVQEGDILLNITGDSVARACQVDSTVLPARVNQHVAIIRTKQDQIDPRFLRYHLVSPAMQSHMLGLAAAGATRNALTKSMIEGLPVPSWPIKYQVAIGSILGAIDDKIELNRRMNETLEAMARAIFKDWFVDFGPTRAKMEGGGPYLSEDIWSLFPNRLESDGTPRGWEITTVGAITHRITKGTTPTSEQVNAATDSASINFLRVNNLSEDGTLSLKNTVQIAQSLHEGVLRRSVLEQDDLLYSIAGTIGRVAKIPRDVLPANVNQAIAIIRPNAELVPPNFLWLWLTDFGFQGTLHSKIVQAVQANLSLGTLSEAPILVPPREIISSLMAPIDALLNRKDHNERESRALTSIRDLLLPKLMSGEVRVKDAEKIVGEAR